jgi:hypothetical protein
VIKIVLLNAGSGNHDALTALPGALNEIIKAARRKINAKIIFNNEVSFNLFINGLFEKNSVIGIKRNKITK